MPNASDPKPIFQVPSILIYPYGTNHCQQKICDSLDLANEFAGFRHLFAKFVQKNKITSFRNKIDFPEKEI